jgi:DcaP outer membrane protein
MRSTAGKTGSKIVVATVALFLLLIAQGISVAQAGNPQIRSLQEQNGQLEAGLTLPTAPSATTRSETSANQPEAGKSDAAGVSGLKTDTPSPTTPPTPQATTDEEKPKPYLDIYGFAQFDLIYDLRTIDPNWYDSERPSKLPATIGQFGKNGNTYASVRQTRFGVSGSQPTGWGEMKYVFEFDLFGVGADAGQTTFRPRKFYGEIGPILAGQTNTVFMDIDVFPNTIEYWGPDGMVFIRQPQLRWTPINGKTIVMVALEKPGASADDGALADRIDLSNIKGRFQYPDVTGAIKHSWGKSYLRAAGVVRNFKIDNVATNNTQSITGWGFNVSSNVAFYKDVLRLQYTVGDGVENYMNDAPVDVGPELNVNNPAMPFKGKAIPLHSFVAYLDHNWSSKWTSAIGYSSLWMSNTSLQTPDAFHRGEYASVNLLCSPFKNFLTGGEFLFGRRTNMSNGYHANDYRIQLSFKYSWNFRVLGKS